MEFLIRVVDKTDSDPNVDITLMKAGDIVVICPDGWGWSPIERTANFWRIVQADILQSTADTLLDKFDPTGSIGSKRARNWYVDISQLPNPSLFTGTRTQEIITLTRQQVSKAVVKK